jgi:hypothetical protein
MSPKALGVEASRRAVERSISETQLEREIVKYLRGIGWYVAHFRTAMNERGDYRTPVAYDGTGFPDLVAVRAPRFVTAELKSATGHLSPAQEEWRNRIIVGQAEWYLWTPRDWFNGTVARTMR